jgi:hypothetical protein
MGRQQSNRDVSETVSIAHIAFGLGPLSNFATLEIILMF